MGYADYFYDGFVKALEYEPTDCQKSLFRKLAAFLTCEDSDIMVVNGYAGTGKTTAVSAAISFLKSLKVNCVLLAPTGRAAKVLSGYAHTPAYTVHKHIYRQKSRFHSSESKAPDSRAFSALETFSSIWSAMSGKVRTTG